MCNVSNISVSVLHMCDTSRWGLHVIIQGWLQYGTLGYTKKEQEIGFETRSTPHCQIFNSLIWSAQIPMERRDCLKVYYGTP